MSSLYLYGITRPRALPRALADDGVSLVCEGDRAAIVSPLGEGGVEPTRSNLLAHAAVVEQLHEDAVVLPARFGTILDDEEAARELLRLEEIEQLLVEHAERSQLNLSAQYDDSVFDELARDVRDLRDAYRTAPSVENGVVLGEAVGDLLAQRRERDANRVLDRLEPCCVAIRSTEPVGELRAFSFELLVERSRVDAVEAELEALARDLSPPLRFRLVGPLPPYGFVELSTPLTA